MALSRCPRSECSGRSFEMKELTVSGANFRNVAIQCSSCGAVVGVMDYLPIGAALLKIAGKLGITLT